MLECFKGQLSYHEIVYGIDYKVCLALRKVRTKRLMEEKERLERELEEKKRQDRKNQIEIVKK